ncbi:MAG: hypothetical protein IJ115_01960 [Erysipelotrichaceae bacterium]|nr:hypothetical protein [Erysipelotrichaceae bacterium]
MVKRIMIWALALLMLFSAFPAESLRVIAESTENPQTEELTEKSEQAVENTEKSNGGG